MEDVPGYDVAELLGFGATGEVWRAVHRATGETVALKRLRPAGGGQLDERVQALVHEAMVLRELDTPYVVRLREVLGTGASTVLVLDHAAGGSLAQLLARRGSLEAGEVVTVAAPLAQALAAAHARGLVHGDVSPANVLFTADGMPLLADLGVARAVGEQGLPVDGTPGYLDPVVVRGADPSPASDVWSLAAVCHHLLAGAPPEDGATPGDVPAVRLPLSLLAPSAPRALVDAVESALSPDPRRRPDAAALAVALRRAHPAAPVRLTGAGSREPQHLPVTRQVRPARVPAPEVAGGPGAGAPARRAWQRRPPRRVMLAVAASGALLVAAGAGWASGRSAAGPATSAPPIAAAPAPSGAPAATAPAASAPAPRATDPGPATPSAAPASTDWRTVLDTLDARRAQAYATADVGLLASVWAPGSRALAGDAAAVRELAAAGRTARGVRHQVVALRTVKTSAERVVLRVTDRLDAATVHDTDGQVVHVVGARADAAYDVVLVRTGAGWRLATVEPA